MRNLSDPNVIKDVMTRHGFSFSKSLGQNFIIDPNVCPKIADESGIDENTGVIEIGAGIGVLTAQMAMRAKKVVCIELDSRLLPVLDETLADFDNITIINADVLKVDLNEIIKTHFSGMKVCVCANLPYYITSPIIMMLLESKLPIESVTVMVQREAADRLCAEVGSRNAGAVTVAVNYYAEAEKLFNVPRAAFMPSPNVDSAVIRLTLRDKPPLEIADEKKFFSIVKAAFGQRRKTASNSISAGTGIPKAEVTAALERAGFSPNVRAESFTMDDFEKLSREIFGGEND